MNISFSNKFLLRWMFALQLSSTNSSLKFLSFTGNFVGLVSLFVCIFPEYLVDERGIACCFLFLMDLCSLKSLG